MDRWWVLAVVSGMSGRRGGHEGIGDAAAAAQYIGWGISRHGRGIRANTRGAGGARGLA